MGGWNEGRGQRVCLRLGGKIRWPYRRRAGGLSGGREDEVEGQQLTVEVMPACSTVCSQQFTKKMGVFSNPTSEASPAKLRLAFEAAPFGLLVEKAGGKTSDGVSGGSVLDVKIEGMY